MYRQAIVRFVDTHTHITGRMSRDLGLSARGSGFPFPFPVEVTSCVLTHSSHDVCLKQG